MWHPSIRWLLLGVAAATLLLPLLALVSLRSFDAALVRQTERELDAQGALVAALVQHAWADARGERAGNPRQPERRLDSFTPLWPRLTDLDQLAPPAPNPLPTRTTPAPEATRARYEALSRVLATAQIFNLSGVRVLDTQGCTLASTRALDECYGALPEVEAALAGRAASALRKRVSDEPRPAFSSLSRRGDLRVFVSIPVWNDGQVIGAVLLSRTAESGLEWLFKQRRDVFYGGLLVLFGAVLVSFGFSRWITRPLAVMKARLEATDTAPLALADVPGPREIHTLGVALDERAKQLEAQRRYVEEFAANVSHELKSPITSIRGAVELLQEQGTSMSEDQRRRFLLNIDAAAERTDRLVSRLLQLARLEARGEREDDPDEAVDVRAWAKAFAERHGSDLALELAVGEGARFGAAALEAVLTNLVDNALRYRRKEPVHVRLESVAGGAPLAKSSAHSQSGSSPVGTSTLHARVTDDGPGISAENQARLFERFFTTDRDRGGTGLGLAIVAATAKARGGRVRLKSDDRGTTVDVWM